MRFLLVFTTACLLSLFGLGLVSSCNQEVWQATQLTPAADSVIKATLPSARKYKFTGPVTITLQHGNNNVATPTTTAKTKGQAVAIGPSASASATKAPLPWWVFALVGVGSIVGWEWVTHQFSLASWLPWRVKLG